MIRTSFIKKDTVIYMDYGEEELNSHSGMRRTFRQTIDLLSDRHILLTSRIVPGGTHCEASWEKQLPFLIHTLMYQ